MVNTMAVDNLSTQEDMFLAPRISRLQHQGHFFTNIDLLNQSRD